MKQRRTRGQMKPKRRIEKDTMARRPKTHLEKTCPALTAAFALSFSGGAMSTMAIYAFDTATNEELTLAPRPLARDIMAHTGSVAGGGLAGMFGMAMASGAASDRRRRMEKAQYAANLNQLRDALKPAQPPQP